MTHLTKPRLIDRRYYTVVLVEQLIDVSNDPGGEFYGEYGNYLSWMVANVPGTATVNIDLSAANETVVPCECRRWG